MRKLNHRVKNLFAVTSGMIALSARSASTPKELATNIRGRLDALAMAHELILPRPTNEEADATAESTSLDDLLRKILSPYDFQDGGEHGRLVMSGPPVSLGRRAVTSFALFVHELATNAAK